MNATTTTQKSGIQSIFDAQLQNYQAISQSTAAQRIKKLKKLRKSIMSHQNEIREALFKDFRKHPNEVDLTEIYPVTGDIKHTISHLYGWMRKRRVGTPLALMGSSSYVHYESKGVCLIISPWNFPVNLTFGPLVSAIAAGNCVVLKPSEHTPHASAIMAKIVKEVFDEKEVAICTGGVEVAKELLSLPFHHIFFTGAPAIGKIIMSQAAKNLTSVTLELGGKSPTIVDETADVNLAGRRIAWSKFLNNGQICIAPDYIYVHEKNKDALIDAINKNIKKMYGDDVVTSDSYCRIVNDRHFDRIKCYMDDAIERDVNILSGGQVNADQDYIAPTLVSNVDDEADLMSEEIFGPVLPIRVYKNNEEVIDAISKRERPLAMYIYSRKRKNINYFINNTRAGGTRINHSAIHFFNNNLPFGGVNNSGIGKAHGEWGFKAFSNERAVLKQWSPLSGIEMMMPPYTGLKEKLIQLSIKYF